MVVLAVSNVRISEEKKQKEAALFERSQALAAAQQSEQDAILTKSRSWLSPKRSRLNWLNWPIVWG